MSEDLTKLEQLFYAAVELTSAEERASFLAQACGADSVLRQRVEKLLRAHETAGLFLNPDTPSLQKTLPLADADLPPSEKPGDQIGQYTLHERIGEGSCCVVYRAEQAAPIRRQVALKLIKAGMDTRQVVARFEVERQALAVMNHPHIAKVFDAGVTAAGRPYFVMELVRGIPITQYCDQHRLTVKQRLELFIQVCHAVQHAHQKGIIHRDLKPSNILVTASHSELPLTPGRADDTRGEGGGGGLASAPPGATHDSPAPKIIDFGIAKAMQVPLTDRAVVTWAGQFVGTPAYMSPEQARMSGEDIDVRTDIYALGVLLYELLTGTTPFDTEMLGTAAYDEIRRIIQETEPPKPSTRLQGPEPQLRGEVAERRQTESGLLRCAVRGDLDWIVMKALEKDRQRRYDTPNALAEDIRRHLAHEPVLAGPPSPVYRARKFVRRHRVWVVVGVVITLALVTGISMALVGLQRALHAEAATSRERDRALEAEQQMRRERDRAIQAEADTHGILSLFNDKLGANENQMALHYAAARLARERLQPTNPATMNFTLPLGRNLGRLGAWTNALEVYFWLTEAAPWSCDLWTHTHATALAAGQPKTSRQLREEIVKRFGHTSDPITVMQVGRAVLIDPDFQEHLPAGLDCAKRAFQAMPQYPWCQIVQGMAEYRRGNWADALKVLQQPERNQDARLGAIAGCFGAMARHQAGQTNAARETLNLASRGLDRIVQTGALSTTSHWHFVVFGLVARAEAERLILGQEVSPRVTAEFLAEAREKGRFVRENLARGESLAREKKWLESGNAYAQALAHPLFDFHAAEQESSAGCLSLQMGIAFVRAGDSTNYARLCRLLLALHPDKPMDFNAEQHAIPRSERYAKTCFLNAQGLSPDQRQEALALARFAVANMRRKNDHHPRWVCQTGGIAEYYAGQPEQAMALLQEAEEDESALLKGIAMVFRAMVLQKLNHPQEAAQVLREAEELYHRSPEADSSLYWWASEHYRLVLEEARQVIRPPITGH